MIPLPKPVEQPAVLGREEMLFLNEHGVIIHYSREHRELVLLGRRFPG